jgi:hypothetical protein
MYTNGIFIRPHNICFFLLCIQAMKGYVAESKSGELLGASHLIQDTFQTKWMFFWADLADSSEQLCFRTGVLEGLPRIFSRLVVRR